MRKKQGWFAEHDGVTTGPYPTKRAVMWMLSCDHMDVKAKCERHRDKGGTFYTYEAPRGEIYVITRKETNWY